MCLCFAQGLRRPEARSLQMELIEHEIYGNIARIIGGLLQAGWLMALLIAYIALSASYALTPCYNLFRVSALNLPRVRARRRPPETGVTFAFARGTRKVFSPTTATPLSPLMSRCLSGPRKQSVPF